MKKLSSVALALVCALAVTIPAVAEIAYPTKNIEFIIPYAAGGGTDALMRVLMAAMEEEWGKSIIISNKGGNLGQVGLTELAGKANDGYTLGALSNLDHILVLLTGENVSYTYDSFEYIGAINTTANVLIASAASGFETLDDMMDYAKKNPGGLTVSVSGKTHIAEAALLERAAGIKVTTIMQSSGGDSLNAVLGGHVDVAILDKKFVAQVDGQGCHTLGIFCGERMDVVPDVPTFKEQGYDVATETYRVIVAPAGTPKEICDAIAETMKKVTQTPEFQEKMANMGEIYRFLGPDEVKARLDGDYQAMVEMLEENPDALSR